MEEESLYNTIINSLAFKQKVGLLKALRQNLQLEELQETKVNANVPNEVFVEIIQTKREFSILSKLNEHDQIWLSFMNERDRGYPQFPPLFQLLASKYLKKYEEITTWYSVYTPKLMFRYENNMVKLERENVNPRPGRDSDALQFIHDKLKETFPKITVNLRLANKQMKDIIMLTVNQQYTTNVIVSMGSKRPKIQVDTIPKDDIVLVILACLFTLEKRNSGQRPNDMINTCVFCGDQATHWMENDHELRVCANELCQLKI